MRAGIRRVVTSFVAVSSLSFLAGACGGSGPDAAPVSTAAVPTSDANDPTSVGTSDSQTSTTTSPEVDEGIDLTELPGRVVFQGVGCAGDSEFSEALEDSAAEVGEIGSVDEAMALIDELGGLNSTIEICVMNPDGTGLVRVSEPEVDAESPGWTYDGETVMYRSNFQWFVVGPDGSGRRPWDDPTRLPWRISPDGRSYLYELLHDQNVYLVPVGQERGGADARTVLTSEEAYITGLRWSPDSSSFLYYEGTDTCPTLWKVVVTSGERIQLTGPGSPSEDVPLCAHLGSASWSPDGSTILLADFEGVYLDPRPYLIDADGTDLRPLVADDFFDDPEWMMTDASWSPDGRYIMIDVVSVVGLMQGEPGLHVIRLSDGLVVPVPIDTVTTIIDMSWMPEAPDLKPIPDEDIDAV
ncbi:MAG: hypothetical protein RLZ37_96 [Actinomycetota bacterium]|jgi:hypothetical protein